MTRLQNLFNNKSLQKTCAYGTAGLGLISQASAYYQNLEAASTASVGLALVGLGVYSLHKINQKEKQNQSSPNTPSGP